MVNDPSDPNLHSTRVQRLFPSSSFLFLVKRSYLFNILDSLVKVLDSEVQKVIVRKKKYIFYFLKKGLFRLKSVNSSEAFIVRGHQSQYTGGRNTVGAHPPSVFSWVGGWLGGGWGSRSVVSSLDL